MGAGMLSVVCWRWTPPPGYRSTFGPETVNTLFRMVARHYPHPFRFLCVTEKADGILPDVEIVPPWNDYADVPSPYGRNNPSCYRRLRAFHPDIGSVFGDRFVSMDLDCVITADLTPLWHREEDFVIWGDTAKGTLYNGSMFLLSAGARAKVWTTFDPVKSPQLTRKAGQFGSDQGWISYCLGPGEARWSTNDGVYSFRNQIAPNRNGLPANARAVFFHGRVDPWSSYGQSIPWIRTHWR